MKIKVLTFGALITLSIGLSFSLGCKSADTNTAKQPNVVTYQDENQIKQLGPEMARIFMSGDFEKYCSYFSAEKKAKMSKSRFDKLVKQQNEICGKIKDIVYLGNMRYGSTQVYLWKVVFEPTNPQSPGKQAQFDFLFRVGVVKEKGKFVVLNYGWTL